MGPHSSARSQAAQAATPGAEGPLNIIYVFSDQQRFTRQWPKGYSLPGLEWLKAKGITAIGTASRPDLTGAGMRLKRDSTR